jgi:hypothetical protein
VFANRDTSNVSGNRDAVYVSDTASSPLSSPSGSQRRPSSFRETTRSVSTTVPSISLTEGTSPPTIDREDNFGLSDNYEDIYTPIIGKFATLTPHDDSHESQGNVPSHIPPELIVSEERRRIILGGTPDRSTPNIAVYRTMQFVIRVLTSWPRLMATHHTSQLPPPIHRLQFDHDGVPKALKYCYVLTKMWVEHADTSPELVRNTIMNEMQRLLGLVRNMPGTGKQKGQPADRVHSMRNKMKENF